MNTLKMKGNWKEITGKLKQQYANLTDDDLLFKEGKEEELLGRLHQKLVKTKEELRKLIEKIWRAVLSTSWADEYRFDDFVVRYNKPGW
jgi:uncharacterized protein YjbJ (UPF0337 family)